MNERNREREEEVESDIPIASGNGLGGIPSREAEQVRGEYDENIVPEEVLDEEHDRDSDEEDDGVIRGRSPEFQHLTKPAHRDRNYT